MGGFFFLAQAWGIGHGMRNDEGIFKSGAPDTVLGKQQSDEASDGGVIFFRCIFKTSVVLLSR